jgi:(1->4)-alpha-D-glucan 1-alpha-D-glucosylmutase
VSADPNRPGHASRRATYRVQLRAEFGFDAVANLADYFRALGVSHVYCSPYLQAVPGSAHGYDVVDYGHVSRELGGADGHDRMAEALEASGLRQLLDIVPNHMAITGRDNAWWWDVLENGPASVYADYFDVDWDPPESKLRNRVLMPILNDHYGRILEAGQFLLSRERGGLVVHYAGHELPVAPRSLGAFLSNAAVRLAPDEPSRPELESLATAFGRLPPSWFTDRESVEERHRDKAVLRSRLAQFCEEQAVVAAAVDAEVAATNGDVDRMDALLDAQNYRLAWWRNAGQESDYRRFFDISTLVGLRVEHEPVFEDSHTLVLEWLAGGVLDGVRVDHVDGLRDPSGYLDRLAHRAPEAWIVIEKILEPGERLAPNWPVAGTTGYDWLNLAGGLFVDPAGQSALAKSYASFTGQVASWPEIAHQAKLEAIRGSLAADLYRLTDLLVDVCEANRRYRDYTRRDLMDCLEQLLAGLPVYRSYGRPGQEAAPTDVSAVEEALREAAARREDLDAELLSFVRDVLLLRRGGPAGAELALRFQQLSGSIMAKGVEDTAFYRYLPLVSLNEVGGDPSRFGTSAEVFHEANQSAHEERPFGLLATSTHDTKRSEDVRARVALLSELPDEWADAVREWALLAGAHRRDGWPDANLEWLCYQTLVGAWPLPADRAAAYLGKAAREAKVHTSWLDPVPEYDRAVRDFVTGFCRDVAAQESVAGFVRPLVRPGWTNSLALKLLTLTAPGIPDLYQGSELWDLSLVDPDNRRQVDFDARRRLLAVADASQWHTDAASGAPKMLVVSRTLGLRARHPEWFGPGEAGRYEPLEAVGPAGDRVVAFVRGGRAVSVVPRLTLGLRDAAGWSSTAIDLPPGVWRDQFTGGSVSGRTGVGDLLGAFPVALLAREDHGE